MKVNKKSFTEIIREYYENNIISHETYTELIDKAYLFMPGDKDELEKEQKLMLALRTNDDIVMLRVRNYFSEHLQNFCVIRVFRYSNHPEDHYLYMVISKKAVIGKHEYAVHSCWNDTTNSLNFGTYGIDSYEKALELCKEKFHDVYNIKPERFIATVDSVDYTKSKMKKAAFNNPITFNIALTVLLNNGVVNIKHTSKDDLILEMLSGNNNSIVDDSILKEAAEIAKELANNLNPWELAEFINNDMEIYSKNNISKSKLITAVRNLIDVTIEGYCYVPGNLTEEDYDDLMDKTGLCEEEIDFIMNEEE